MFSYLNPNMNNVNNTNNNVNNMHDNNCGCQKPKCQTTYQECQPIVTCSEEVIDHYHITRQPYIHNYHTKVVHHNITENCFIPKYTCSEVHIDENPNVR